MERHGQTASSSSSCVARTALPASATRRASAWASSASLPASSAGHRDGSELPPPARASASVREDGRLASRVSAQSKRARRTIFKARASFNGRSARAASLSARANSSKATDAAYQGTDRTSRASTRAVLSRASTGSPAASQRCFCAPYLVPKSSSRVAPTRPNTSDRRVSFASASVAANAMDAETECTSPIFACSCLLAETNSEISSNAKCASAATSSSSGWKWSPPPFIARFGMARRVSHRSDPSKPTSSSSATVSA
mmetsp:Transcript_8482/g.21683  ORF Transcript_8482/g.21683 Transcript_8482/m.21683 type:complete len:257 (+) Transcript_8482:72-842(+)